MTQTTTTNTTSSNITFIWDTGAIFDANFGFPYGNINNEDELKDGFTEEEFSEHIIQLLTPCQPLDNHERSVMTQAVKSGNRLRILFLATKLVQMRCDALNETTQNGDISDNPLRDNFEQNGYQVKEIGVMDEEDQYAIDTKLLG